MRTGYLDREVARFPSYGVGRSGLKPSKKMVYSSREKYWVIRIALERARSSRTTTTKEVELED